MLPYLSLLFLVSLKFSILDCAYVNNHASCAGWVANGFCQNSWYTCEQKRSYCSASCNIGSCSPQTSCASASAGTGSSGSLPACTTDDARCATWIKNGFCQQNFYTCEQKRSFCGTSCKIGGCNPQTSCSSSSSGATQVVCQDGEPTKCATWKANGFCTATFYTCAQKQQYCSLTCNIGDCSRGATCSNSGSGSTNTTTTTAANGVTTTTKAANSVTTKTVATSTTTTTAVTCKTTPGFDISGNDMTESRVMTSADPLNECCDLCKNTAGCVGFAWIHLDSTRPQNDKGKCYIKNKLESCGKNGNITVGVMPGSTLPTC